MLNDADAAGIAEARFGAAKGVSGVVIMLTFGTGIGSALLVDGKLVPNTELGHLELDGHDAETRAAASVREKNEMSYKKWAQRVQKYMSHVERLFSPDLFVVGGGVSKEAQKWVPLLIAERSGEARPAAEQRRYRRRGCGGRRASGRVATPIRCASGRAHTIGQYTAKPGHYARTGLEC